jgi:hypothetical protein
MSSSATQLAGSDSGYARSCQASREASASLAAMFTARCGCGGGGHEVFVQQSKGWGVEAQVDWYEPCADLDGECTRLAERWRGSQAQFWCLAKARTDLTKLPLVSR